MITEIQCSKSEIDTNSENSHGIYATMGLPNAANIILIGTGGSNTNSDLEEVIYEPLTAEKEYKTPKPLFKSGIKSSSRFIKKSIDENSSVQSPTAS